MTAQYRVHDGEFGLATLPQDFARFAQGEFMKPVLPGD
jgi:hypothetical protein